MTRTWFVIVLSLGISALGCEGLTEPAGEADLAGAEDLTGPAGTAEPMKRMGATEPTVSAGLTAIGQPYQRDVFRNLLAGESFTATAMCDTGDILIGHYVAGQNITVNSATLIDPVVLFTGAATQGWRAVVTGTSGGPGRFVNVTAICLDFAL